MSDPAEPFQFDRAQPMILTETDLAAMVRAIVDAIQPERIILFGSLAFGEATKGLGS